MNNMENQKSTNQQCVALWKQMFESLFSRLPEEERTTGYMIETCFDEKRGSHLFEAGEYIWISLFPMRNEQDILDQTEFFLHANDAVSMSKGETYDIYLNYIFAVDEVYAAEMKSWKQAYEGVAKLIDAWCEDATVFPPAPKK